MQNGLIELPLLVPRLRLGGLDVQDSAASPIELGQPANTAHASRAPLTAIAVGIAMLLHLAVAAALILAPSLREAGAGGEIEAAGVELFAGSTVESLASTSDALATASEQVSTNAGEENNEVQPPIAAADTSLQNKTEPQALEAKSANGEIAATPELKPENKPEEAAAKTDEKGQGKDISRTTSQDAVINGGAISRGTSEVIALSEAAAAASEGEMSRYAADVHKALVRQRPRHGGTGRVKIEFVLTAMGIVSDAAILNSSGDAQLDSLAVNAVRSARFPPPPARANHAQLRYTTIIKFR